MTDDFIDFNTCPTRQKGYDERGGSKIAVEYQGDLYMLKFSRRAKQNQNAFESYVVTEYLGCRILSALGLPTQEVLLGTYTAEGKERLVVACKDFCIDG